MTGSATKRETIFSSASDDDGRALELGTGEDSVILPDDQVSLFHAGYAAVWRQDWREALRAWGKAERLFPDNSEARLHVGLARQQVNLLAAESGEPAPRADAQTIDSALMMRFESLGDNCEFGIVQRNYRAEPLGLLRWASISPHALCQNLQRGFANVGGSPKLEVRGGEYYLIDSGFSMHTSIREQDVQADAVLAQQRRRLIFLRDKLLRDLHDAEKVFLYKTRDGVITNTKVTAIHQAIRVYGSTRLLIVRLATDEHLESTIEDFGDGLLIGYIGTLSVEANHKRISYSSWLALCRAAFAKD